MAENITLTNLVNLSNQTTAVNAINSNNTTITNAFKDVLSLSGVAPNQMQANLDMNSNQILNLPAPLSGSSPLRLQDAATLNGGGTITGLPVGGTAAQVLTKNSSTNYDASWANATNTSSTGINTTQTGTGAVSRTLAAKVNEVISIKDYGGVGDGVTDNTAALNAALASLTGTGGNIYFPSGKYRFNSNINFVFPAGVFSVGLWGSGQESSILYWPAGGGLTLTYNNLKSRSDIRDLSFTTGATNTGSAILLIQNTAGSASISATSSINHVSIHGDDGYAGTFCWANGININNVNDINIEDVTIFGGNLAGGGYAGLSSGTGINIIGNASLTSFATGVNIGKSFINYLANGLVYGTFVQGVSVVQSNFTGCQIGINVPISGSNLDELFICDTQFNCSVVAITLATAVGTTLIGNLFIIPLTNSAGVVFSPNINFTVSGNLFESSTITGTNGLVIGPGSTQGTVNGNIFDGLNTAVWFQAGSQNTQVANNTFTGNTTSVLNQATASTITILDNPGYNPVGPFAITVGASPFTYTAGASPETVYVRTAGTISQIVIQGSLAIAGAAAASGVPITIELGPYENFTTTYATSTPIMDKMIH